MSFVLLRGLSFKSAPLFLKSIAFLLQAITFSLCAFKWINSIRKFSAELSYFIRLLLYHSVMLGAECLDNPFRSFHLLLGDWPEIAFNTTYSMQILLLFKQNTVSLQIGIFNSLPRFLSQVKDLLFFFLIESNFGFLLFQQRDNMVIFTCSHI